MMKVLKLLALVGAVFGVLYFWSMLVIFWLFDAAISGALIFKCALTLFASVVIFRSVFSIGWRGEVTKNGTD